MQEEVLDQNRGTADLVSDLSQYDNSNLGLYKGTFTTLDASERGIVEVKILHSVPSRATLTLSSGATYALQSTSVATAEQDTNLSFVTVSESKLGVSFDLSVNADGTNVEITNTNLGTRASHIIAAKETSRGPVVPIAGSFDCTSCGTTNWTGPQTFNLLFIGDPSGAGNGTLDTDFTVNGTTHSSVGTGDNNQTGCVVNGDFMDCAISGFTTITNNMTWTGTHTYNNTVVDCSQVSGTWSYVSPSVGNLAGTFTSDTQCVPSAFIGEFRDGGVVFWVDPTNPISGLVCAINDAPTQLEWGCYLVDLPNVPNVNSGPSGPGAEIGDGMSNTDGILNDCPTAPAASYARSLGADWFLPSALELNEIYENKSAINATAIANGGAAFQFDYWSSTENRANDAWLIDSFGDQIPVVKSFPRYVRAVKAFPPPPPLPAAIGDFRNGGVVFWVDPADNTHGLLCAINDAPAELQWGCVGTDLPSVPNVQNNPPSGPGAEIGDGMSNTIAILATTICSSPAASYAHSLGPEWFLPSTNELKEMRQNRAAINATAIANGGAAFQNDWYWSSTEYDIYGAWFQDFSDGSQTPDTKIAADGVRPVRAF